MVPGSLLGDYPSALHEILSVELTYALTRHQLWIDSSPLKILCLAWMQSRFRLPRPLATQIFESAQSQLVVAATSLPFKDIDREFIRYLTVNSFYETCEKKIEGNIGLGNEITQLLLKSRLDLKNENSTTHEFISPVHAICIEVRSELERLLTTFSGMIEAYQLLYVLLSVESSKTWSLSDAKKGLEGLYQIGRKRWPEEDWLIQFSQVMNQAGFIFSTLVKKKPELRLSASGYEITRHIFAEEFKDKEFSEVLLGSIPSTWQREWIQKGDARFLFAFAEFMKNSPTLSAQVTELALDRMERIFSLDDKKRLKETFGASNDPSKQTNL